MKIFGMIIEMVFLLMYLSTPSYNYNYCDELADCSGNQISLIAGPVV